MSIEKTIRPDSGRLKIDTDGAISAVILDAELDPVELEFISGGIVEINTGGEGGFTYIQFTKENLKQILRLLDEAEKEYEKT